MNILIPLPIFLMLLFSNCTSGPDIKNVRKEGQLIFQSGFEDLSRVITLRSDADIVGTDKSLPDHNDWVKDFDNNPNIGNFNLQYQGGDSTQRFAKIIPEPGNPSNHVLHFWLNEPNVSGSKGRIQGNIYGNNGLHEFYQSVRVFLPEDINTVRKYPDKITWLTIAEFWNNITWNQDVPYRFRITLGMGKPVPEESDLYFILDAQDCELFEDGKQKYSTIWSEINRDVAIPIGKWFKMDYYYKEGNAETGRFYLAITPEGEKTKVIFDLKKITHNTQDANPDGVGDFNPIKLYTSKGLIDFMRSKGKTLQIFWDDFKLWKDKGVE
jgi:hypothetical protein